MVKIAFRASAEKELDRLPRALRKMLLACCKEVFDDWAIGKTLSGSLSGFRVHGSTSLTTSRTGMYRIIYEVKESSHIEIVAIGHRRDILNV